MAKKVREGQKFGRWTVLRRVTYKHKPWFIRPRWFVRCSCGKRRSVMETSLLTGKSQSCGCARIDAITKHHGAYRSEYPLWTSMKQRCHNPKAGGYRHYGGRGISVCKRWRKSFAAFLADMGPRPSLKHSLDRFPDQNGNYCPSNCRWATRKEQRSNMVQVKFFTHRGKTMHLNDWAKHLGVSRSRLKYRLDHGFTFSEAVGVDLLRRRCPVTGRMLPFRP